MKIGYRRRTEEPAEEHSDEQFPAPTSCNGGGRAASPEPGAPDSIASLLSQLPDDCIAVSADIRYWNAWRLTAEQGSPPLVEYLSSTALKELLGHPGEHLHSLGEVLQTHGDRPVVTVRANKEGVRALAQALSSRLVPLVEGAGGAAAWSGLDIVKSALENDMASLGRRLLDESEDAVRAIAGGIGVASRDVIGRTVTPARFEQKDVLVLEDRRLLLVNAETSLARNLTETYPKVTVLDIGSPEKITVTPEHLTIRGSKREEEEVTVMIAGRRVVTGYRQVPTALRLPEAVGVSVLMTLVGLGAGATVEQEFPPDPAPTPTGSRY